MNSAPEICAPVILSAAVSPVEKEASQTERVQRLWSPMKVKAMRWSFQAGMNANTPEAITPGTTRGEEDLAEDLPVGGGVLRAASSLSTGMAMKKPRITQTENGSTRAR
ncbi:hypothetical protein ACH41H_48105 [Streptomyces sp. NPDC020800]|uniref:hypothetical protein n=1 Tax=Streptomyces sp. NPDC020800 TaxID=3365092 RepID=UPI00379AEAD5